MNHVTVNYISCRDLRWSPGRKYQAFIRILFLKKKQNKTLPWLLSIQEQVIVINKINRESSRTLLQESETVLSLLSWNFVTDLGLIFHRIQSPQSRKSTLMPETSELDRGNHIIPLLKTFQGLPIIPNTNKILQDMPVAYIPSITSKHVHCQA